MKPIDVKSSIYISFDVQNNDRSSKFKVGGHERISEYRNIIEKGYTTNWSEKGLVITVSLIEKK